MFCGFMRPHISFGQKVFFVSVYHIARRPAYELMMRTAQRNQTLVDFIIVLKVNKMPFE